MKPNALMDVEITGNLVGETIEMDFDPEATHHLMSVLTNLYSDRLLACIREYSTNALDANREAGVSDPIEVSLPNFASTYLTISDKGNGLSLDDLRRIYSKYGASTKRDSNEYNGMLGVGSKAGLTYTPTFTVVSVNGGMRYTVAVSLNEVGVGEMQVVGQEKTVAPSGVTIQIPIKKDDRWNVREKAVEFFSWWEPGTVLLDGVEPKRRELSHIVGNIYSHDLIQDVIVMAGVAYPIPGERKVPEGLPSIAYFAETGEVNFSPSRESIRFDARAKRVVDQIIKDYTENFRVSLQAKVDQAGSPAEALNLARGYRTKYSPLPMEFTYKGREVPEDYPQDVLFRFYTGERDVVTSKAEETFYSAPNGGRSSRTGRPSWNYRWLQAAKLENVVIITDAPVTMSPYSRTKARDIVRQEFGTITRYYFYNPGDGNGSIDNYWFKGANRISWKDITKKYAENNRANRSASSKAAGTYTMYGRDGIMVERLADPGEKYLFTDQRGIYSGKAAGMASTWLTRLGYDYLVTLPENRKKKFIRLFGGDDFYTSVRKSYQSWVKSIPEERLDSISIARSNDSRGIVFSLEAWKEVSDEILDPVTRGILDRYRPDLDKSIEAMYNRYHEANVVDGYYSNYLNLAEAKPENKVFQGMPALLNYGTTINQVLEIFNALYLYRKDKNNGS